MKGSSQQRLMKGEEGLQLAVLPERARHEEAAAIFYTRKRVRKGLALAIGVAGLALASYTLSSSAASARSPDLGVIENRLTIGGKPEFLLGVSLFDALGWVPPSDSDLDQLSHWGVDIVRVWAHWHHPIYEKDGSLSDANAGKIKDLLGRLEARGMALELVLLRPGQLAGEPAAHFVGASARLEAARSLTRALKGRRSVMFDLYNEHDHPHGPISHKEARAIRDSVKNEDPSRIVTISSTEHHFVSGGGGVTVSPEGEANLRAEVGQGPDDVAVDVLAPHFPRTSDWHELTGERIAAVDRLLARTELKRPIYLNEENRQRESTARPTTDEFLRAARHARDAGAAGWIFHSGAGYDLSAKSYLQALSSSERQTIARLRDVVRGR